MSPQKIDLKELKYTDLPNGVESWYEPTDYLPYPYDLVRIKTIHKELTGWWTGYKWMGLRLGKKSQVKQWKKVSHLEFIDF